MILSAIRTEILSWLSPLLDCPATWTDPTASGGAQPPYAVLQLRRVDRMGADELRPDGGPDEIRVVGSRLVTVRALAYGPDALDRLCGVQSSTSIPSIRGNLGGGLSLLGDSGVVSESDGSVASLELRFLVPFEALDRPGEITRALVDVEVRRPDGSPGLTDTVEFSR